MEQQTWGDRAETIKIYSLQVLLLRLLLEDKLNIEVQ